MQRTRYDQICSSSNFPSERRCSRVVGALALVGLVLLGACATSPERQEWTAVSRSGADGEGARLFARLPTDFAPVQVGDAELKAALVTLVLDMPLRVATSTPVRPGRGLAPGSGGSGGQAWQSDLAGHARPDAGAGHREHRHLGVHGAALVLAPTVVAMAEWSGGGGRPVLTGGTLLPNGHRAWRSHNGITRALGSPGKGKRWHHIVEQHKGNIERFGPEAIHKLSHPLIFR
jgi:hypothetical protein